MSDINQYKIRARGTPGWNKFSTVRMEISVGQQYHEGAKFEAALNWACNNFDRVIIIIGDTPQRYNFMHDGMHKDLALEKAIFEGNEWLKRNKKYIDRHCNKVEVTRWDDWRLSDNYKQTRWQIGRLYQHNAQFRNSLKQAINEKFERGNDINSDYFTFFRLSLQYLLEETAVFSLVYGHYKGISAYPGSFLEMWSMFIDKKINGAPDGLQHAHCLRLSYNRRKSA